MKSVLIFSVQRDGLTTKENNTRHKLAKIVLDAANVPYKNVDGVYMGQTEASFLVDWEYWSTVQELCQASDQDCFLAVNLDGNVALVAPTFGGETKLNGKFQKISREYALSLDNFSRLADSNEYWAVV